MYKDRNNVTALAAIIGKESIIRPYINQKVTPVVINKNIPEEISLVLLVLKTLTACGINDIVVQAAAKYPNVELSTSFS